MSFTIHPDSTEGIDESDRPGLIGRAVSWAKRLPAAIGITRPRLSDGTYGPRRWKRLAGVVGSILAVWLVVTTVHVVPAGNVGVPVTLGKAGDPVGQGMHVTWPFTSMKLMSARTTAYTMSAAPGEGNRSNVDDSVQVLGSDGASGSIDSTVLFRLDSTRATEVYNDLGVNYVLTLVRPSARTCIRSVFTDATMVEAATTAWHRLEQDVTACMEEKLEPRGIFLEDFQLREVHLDPTLQAAVTAKTAAQQDSERQQFELSIAQQRAEITRVDAIATADAQQILACGGRVEVVTREDGTTAQVVIPNPVDQCSQAQLTPAYLQWTYIQALRGLVDSPNNSTIILPFDQSLTPLINVSGAPGTGPVATPPDTGAQVSEPGSDTTTTTNPAGG